jgi:hypothetical protein
MRALLVVAAGFALSLSIAACGNQASPSAPAAPVDNGPAPATSPAGQPGDPSYVIGQNWAKEAVRNGTLPSQMGLTAAQYCFNSESGTVAVGAATSLSSWLAGCEAEMAALGQG